MRGICNKGVFDCSVWFPTRLAQEKARRVTAAGLV
jgi:hypothetical protein